MLKNKVPCYIHMEREGTDQGTGGSFEYDSLGLGGKRLEIPPRPHVVHKHGPNSSPNHQEALSEGQRSHTCREGHGISYPLKSPLDNM